ncbi:MAG: hypothetical protein ACR2OY_06490 [Boseongicola sp.]
MSNFAFWFIQIPGWALLFYLLIAQCIPAFSYQIGIRMGTQEPAESITDVGVAFFKGFAVGDLVVYVPLLSLGLVGQIVQADWAQLMLGAALGVTIYWPVVCLLAVRSARNASGWSLPKEEQYWIVLPIISLWGICGLVLMLG